MLPIHWAGKERGDGLAAVTPLTTHTEAQPSAAVIGDVDTAVGG